MNRQALNELSNKCIDCIETWKKENWYKPLNIENGEYIEHCRIYGDSDIQLIYEEVWGDAPEDDEEVQKALSELEHHLQSINHREY